MTAVLLVKGGEFQFHYGTIEGGNVDPASIGILHFNSTMVRLRVPPGIANRYDIPFQFHYGTIEGQIIDVDEAHKEISIPLWYD